MATLTLRNIPDELYEYLERSAEQHRRSINQEAIFRLEQLLCTNIFDVDAILARARSLREKAAQVYVTDADLRTIRR